MNRKKLLAIGLLLILAASAYAQKAEETNPFSLYVSAGLYYDARPLTGTAFDFLLFIFNLRGGAGVHFNLKLADVFGLGAEAGVYYMYVEDTLIGYFDIPLRGVVTLDLGGFMIQGIVGVSFLLGGIYTFNADIALDAGGRISLGGLYIEGSYVLNLTGTVSFPRFGIGYIFDIF